MSETTLKGRRVFVTGAATGIGRATAEHLVDLGASVFGGGLDEEEGKALEAQYRDRGLPLHFRKADLTREAEVRAVVADAAIGFNGLDAVVNCAGIYETGKRLEDVTDAEWERTIAVN